MGARDLLANLTLAGVTVAAAGDRLVVRPASRLTDDLRSALREAKPEVLALLIENAERRARRRARLLRWGWPLTEAEATAERLARRDAEADDRVSCAADCAHFRLGHCGNHRRAGLTSAEIGRELATMLQRCPGFQPTR